jgi:cobalt-zinc-cadmium resistance protein CzcA
MLARIVQFALTQRVLVLIGGLVLTVGGAYALMGLPIDAFPDVAPTQVKMILKAPGMTPEEVESRIVTPLEQELLGIPQQTVLRSAAKYGIADVTLDFAAGTDLYWARQQVSERLASVIADLPPTVSGGMAPVTTPLGDILMFTVEGPLSLAEKRTLIDWTIRPRLRTIPGVADVNALGGFVRTLEVVPDPIALQARGLSVVDLAMALRANIGSDGSGRISDGEESLPVRIDATVKSPAEVGAIAVRSIAGAVVRVADVATVRIGELTRYGAVSKDGNGEAAEGLILALKGANARDVVSRVKTAMTEIERTLPKGVKLHIFYDRGFLVERAIGSVSKALVEATVLVIILLLLFLGDVRAALVVTVLLPTTVLATFIVMRMIGLSANLMSLGGLAIAIGLLVDAGVVVVENVLARLGGQAPAVPAPRLHAVYRAVKEVATPVAGGIAIIAVVFLPLLALQGLEGKLFSPVAVTIVISLLSSLLISLTLIPVLASTFIKDGAHEDPWVMRRLARGFEPLLQSCLRNERRTVGIAIAGIVVAFVTVPFIGKSFLPTMDEGDIIMQLAKLPSMSLTESLRIDQALERRIRAEVPEATSVIARTGSDELGLDPMGLNETDVFLKLRPRREWKRSKDEIIGQLRRIGDDLPGVEVSFTQPIEMRVAEMLTGTRGDVAIKVFGPDLATLDSTAQAVKRAVGTVRGAEDPLYVSNNGVQYIEVRLNRGAAGIAGVTAAGVQETLRGLVEGTKLGVVQRGERRESIVMRGDSGWRAEPARLASLPVSAGTGTPLASIATIQTVEGPVRISRENAARFAVVQVNVRDRDLVGFVADAKAKVAQAVTLPEGFRLEWGGQFENQQRAAARLLIVVPIALALVFFLLFSTLGSVRQAVLVFANIPFALVGGILALAAAREYLSVPAAVGFIALIGIAVLNGLVLVSHFNELLARGMEVGTVVVQGVKRRLRPVFMTASITALGLIPVLMASGPGSEIQRPLAIVVIGGLVSSTALTLIVLPILFRRFGVSRA